MKGEFGKIHSFKKCMFSTVYRVCVTDLGQQISSSEQIWGTLRRECYRQWRIKINFVPVRRCMSWSEQSLTLVSPDSSKPAVVKSLLAIIYCNDTLQYAYLLKQCNVYPIFEYTLLIMTGSNLPSSSRTYKQTHSRL